MSRSQEALYIPDQGDVFIIDATNGIACVDPRTPIEVPDIGSHLYAKYTDQGEVRTPGASVGDIMALLKTRPDLSVEEATLLVVSWEMSPEEGRVAAFHGDTQDGDIFGCGHIAKSASDEYSEHYGIDAALTREITRNILLLNNLNGETRGIPMARPILSGNHNESGVFVVESEYKTVIPQTDQGRQFFRYDHLRHDGRLDRLAAYATSKAADGLLSVPINTIFDIQELRDAATQQRNATLGIIAVGLPIYEINMIDGSREVSQVGEVEPVAF